MAALTHPVEAGSARSPVTDEDPPDRKSDVAFRMETTNRETGFGELHPSGMADRPVTERGWGPTIALRAVLLAAVLVVVARPLAAGAAPGRTHSSAALVRSARKVPQVTPGVATSPNWSGYVAYAKSINNGSFNLVERRSGRNLP